MTSPDMLKDQFEGTVGDIHQSVAVHAGTCTLERVAELQDEAQPASDEVREAARLDFVFRRWGVSSE